MAKKKKFRNPVKLLPGIAALTAAVLLVGGMSALQSGPSGQTGEEKTVAGAIRISEVMASNSATLLLSDGSAPDWIELENVSSAPVSLSGYAIMADDDPSTMSKLNDVTIEPGGYALIYADNEDATPSTMHAAFRIASGGTKLTLLDPSGTATDIVTTLPLEKDWVCARDASGEWKVSTIATPLTANRIVTGSEQSARAASCNDGNVILSEVMTSDCTWYAPDGKPYDYIELANVTDTDVSLKGWTLSDNAEKPRKWELPDTAIPAGGTLLVWCTGGATIDGAVCAPFRLSADGTDVILTDAANRTVAAVTVPALEKDQAYIYNGSAWTTSNPPSPGYTNTAENAAIAVETLRRSTGCSVIINEVCAATGNQDWIELYNAGTETVDLSGWGLTDNAGRPRKWCFAQGTLIAPGAYLGVLCTGKDTIDAKGYMNTSYRLGADGGYTVVLSRPDGTPQDHTYVPPQFESLTYGRGENANGFYYYSTSTPGAVNAGNAYRSRANAPEYSVRGGLFTTGDTLTVEITSEPGTTVYYTLDSSDPSQSSERYTGPITISGTTILRTRVYGDACLESFIDTQSYIYDVSNGSNVYVVSLVSDPYNLTSEEAGIMIKGPNAETTFPYNGANYWQDWEREAHIEIYDANGNALVTSGCGIKLHGQYSRAEKQQAFKVYARTKYGSSSFDYPLFSNRPYTSYSSFLLRSSGQDTDKVRMRDSVLTALASDTSVMYQETEICILYLDGRYWGQYNIREHISPSSIAQFEGWEGQEDDIDLVKANRNTMQGSNQTFADLVEWAKNTDPTASDFYEKLSQVIDIRNYMEYMAVEIFVGNGDTANVKRYRNANDDGRWRWCLFDLDWAFCVDTDSINRWLTPGGMGTNKGTDNSLFIACMKNPQFRDEFLTYMGEQMATTFSTENVIARFEERYRVLEPLLPEQLERWGMTEKKYASQLKELLTYAKERPLKLLGYFSKTSYLKLSTDDMYKYFGEALAVAQAYSEKEGG